MNNLKEFIGIFDSGIGGLSVYETIKNALPNENYIYLADQYNCPYGTKSKKEIRDITLNNISYLKKLGAKLIVIACNTATSSVMDYIEQKNENIIGVIEPTAREALKKCKGKIGLLATDLTVSTNIYHQYLGDYLVESEGCSDLVLKIEKNEYDSEVMMDLIRHHLEKIKIADTIILGCTHFKLIKKRIEELLENSIIIDSCVPTMNEVIRHLNSNHQLTISKEEGDTYFYTTGAVSKALEQLKKLGFVFDVVRHIDI